MSFAFDFYRQLSKREGNLVFSPYSISSALAMTYAGAHGETARQMEKALHFSLGQEHLHPEFSRLTQHFLSDGSGARRWQLHVANALWGQRGLPFHQPFLELLERQYRAGLREVDFVGASAVARKQINCWAVEQTRGKIKEAVPEGEVGPQTRLLVTSTAYFKAGWLIPFPEKSTQDAEFTTGSGKTIRVPMMHQPDVRLRYYSGPTFELLELPYVPRTDNTVQTQWTMLLLLPRQKGGVAAVEKTLTATQFQEAVAKLSQRGGKVWLPRFRLARALPLTEDLQTLGMSLPFSAEADFSGMVKAPGLRVTRVIHQATLSVDERGTEAAAFTSVALGVSETRLPFSFRADHPFLCVIRDQDTGTILFQARVSQPALS